MGYHGALLGETFHVLGFALEVAHRDKERKIGIAVTGALETNVKFSLNVFPQGVPPRLDHHATANR